MGLVLDMTPIEERQIARFAAQEGVSITEYARRKLLPDDAPKKRSVMEFAGVVTDKRTAEAMEAELQDSRASWDDPDYYKKQEATP